MALRVALLGCGPLGRRYADLVTASGSTVLVVFDADQGAAATTVGSTGGRIAPSLRDAVTAVGVDAVVACLQGDERNAAIESAAGAGRPIFDASPLTDAANSALVSAREAGLVVGLDLRRRHDSRVRELVEAVTEGQVGNVRSCSIADRDESMGFEDSLLQDLDLARHLMGSDIASVAAAGNDLSTMVLLTHADGGVTSIENSQHAPAGSELRIEVAGVSGTISTGPSSHPGVAVATAHGQWHTRQSSVAAQQSLAAQWAGFVDDVGLARPTEIVADVGTALLARRAVTRSLAEGRRVDVVTG